MPAYKCQVPHLTYMLRTQRFRFDLQSTAWYYFIMATTEQIEQFSRFAKQLSEEEGTELPLAAIFDRWHAEATKDQDLLAIQASAKDFDNGERGRPVEEFLQEFDAARRADKSK